jgi:hypothetical protein
MCVYVIIHTIYTAIRSTVHTILWQSQKRSSSSSRQSIRCIDTTKRFLLWTNSTRTEHERSNQTALVLEKKRYREIFPWPTPTIKLTSFSLTSSTIQIKPFITKRRSVQTFIKITMVLCPKLGGVSKFSKQKPYYQKGAFFRPPIFRNITT